MFTLVWKRTAIEYWKLNDQKLLDGLISENLSDLNFLCEHKRPGKKPVSHSMTNKYKVTVKWEQI